MSVNSMNIRNYLFSEIYLIIVFNIRFCGEITFICEFLKVFTTLQITEWLRAQEFNRIWIYDLKRSDLTADFVFLPLSVKSIMFSHTVFLYLLLFYFFLSVLSRSLNFYDFLFLSLAESITLILMIERPVNVLKSRHH